MRWRSTEKAGGGLQRKIWRDIKVCWLLGFYLDYLGEQRVERSEKENVACGTFLAWALCAAPPIQAHPSSATQVPNASLSLSLDLLATVDHSSIHNIQLIIERSYDFLQEIRTPLTVTTSVPFSSSPNPQPQIVLQPYRSELPDYLIGIIDQIIKSDEFHVLRQDFLHHPLEELVFAQPEPRNLVWLFADPQGQANLISMDPHPLLPVWMKDSEKPQRRMDALTLEDFQASHLTCSNLLARQLQPHQLQDIRLSKYITIEHLRANCQGNLYTSPLQFQADLRRLIAWNQVFRADSAKTFGYLSILYEKIIAVLTKKDLFRKFYEVKQGDLNRLMKYQTHFKTNAVKWPIVPSSFREYEEIDRYVPTPPQRTPMINQRLLSQKAPIECEEDCVCLSDKVVQGKEFCKYSLLNGWESDCPNRVRKIECQHQDPERMKRCRNSEIKKRNRKRCAGKMLHEGGEPQIEERLTWGIDLYTRNVIYHCLPELDIDGTKKTNNDAKRNYFIQRSLAKAMNFMGAQGFNLLQTCKYIMEHSQISPQTQQTQEEKLFTARDYLYADILSKNYNLAEDKTGFRVHTKGKGAICIDHKGIDQGDFIVQYFGEIYEPWRWYDRQDFIKEVLKKKKLKNYIPQFYNIYLEKHPDQPLGYDILVVDPSKMGNFSSRFSHSCEPNCGTVITVSEGRYYIGMYAFRPIQYGQELTFDYCSMTESNYQHVNSICLCGMRKCRGNYLQLSNNKIFNNLMDNRNCFYARNSAVLLATGQPTVRDMEMCAAHNIKDGFLEDTPSWIIRWMARVLAFMEEEGEIYKNSLIEQWRKTYPWDTSEDPEEKEKKIQLYSETSKQDLIILRFQNLITSVDKLKYFFSRNEMNQNPPIFVEAPERILEVLVLNQDSVLLQLQQCLIKYKCQALARTIQFFLEALAKKIASDEKLFLFRLCCLVISHKLLYLTEADFSYDLLSDIIYFYSFTHTYFSPNEYKPFEADEIVVGLSDILGEKGHANERKEKSKKKYASPFVWGQVASWYKQTIVCPEASLSQDRRGTLSYPLIKSIMQPFSQSRKSEYPYDKQTRANFHRTLLERPANSWPPASGCDLSFKNPYKLYGTMLFQNVHSRDRLAGKLPKDTLLESCLSLVHSSFRLKLALFKSVEESLSKTNSASPRYSILEELQLDYDANVPLAVRNSNHGESRKRIKRQSQQSQ